MKPTGTTVDETKNSLTSKDLSPGTGWLCKSRLRCRLESPCQCPDASVSRYLPWIWRANNWPKNEANRKQTHTKHGQLCASARSLKISRTPLAHALEWIHRSRECCVAGRHRGTESITPHGMGVSDLDHLHR